MAEAKNVIIFVADGLRNGSINPTDAPTLTSIRQQGVNFVNSHSLFPTFTTPNASAIATGHYLGDTGDFSNTIYTGFPTPNANGSITPFIENNPVLGDIDEKFPGNNFLDEESLLSYARAKGYNTAAVGKLGPVLIQDVTQGNRVGGTAGNIPTPKTIIIDDTTNGVTPPKTTVGSSAAVPLDPDVAARLAAAGLDVKPTARVQPSGNNTTPGTTNANIGQQQYFADATTKAILPKFNDESKPFAMVYWSRDPDGSQHNQGDSLNSLTPGINGATSKAAVKNADTNLKQILDYLKATGLDKTTDVFVTADHGFSTISKQAVDNQGTKTTSYAATQTYTGVNQGFLPPGFVAIDLAKDLNQPLYDPDPTTLSTDLNNIQYTAVDATKGQRPRNGNGVIGGTGKVTNGKTDGQVIVAANGGSDLIYLPTNDKVLAQQVVNFLSQKDYISGIFLDDSYGSIAGTLPLSSIGLKGDAKTPIPAMVINFKTFSTDSSNPNNPQAQVEIADSGLQQGQGMHGSFGRGDTFNNMAAIGPDFKQGYMDYAPVSNADVTPTLARILGLQLPSSGNLKGRPITEALVGGPDKVSYTTGTLTSPAANGQSTILNYQTVGDAKYFTAAGFNSRTVGLTTSAPGVAFGQNNSLTLDNGFGSLLFTLTPTNKSNEIGVFLVDDEKGTISGIAAGNTKEYIQAALKRSQTLFSALPGDDVLQVTKQSQQRQLSFPQGAKLGFYSVADDTSNKVLTDLASGVTPDKTASIFFNFNGANRDGSNHIKVDNLGNSTFQLNWDNGSIFKVQAQASNVQTNVDAGALNILIDSGATSQVTPIQLVVNSEAAYNDFVGYYRVSDASGTVVDNGKTYKPGDVGYASAAIRQASQDLGLSNDSNLNSSGRSTNSKNANLTGGSLYAPLLIANGDIQSFLGKNANNDPNNGNNPLAYFAYVNANPDKVDHIRGIGGNTIGFEDLFGGGDRDFNDIVLQLNASKPLVTSAIAI